MPKPRPNLPRSYPLFTLFGFEVRLNLSWLLLGMLIAWTLAEGFFPQQYPDLQTATRWWMGIAGALGILLSIVFHELSHSLVGRRLGLPVHGITLFIFGGMAEIRQEPPSPRTELLTAGVGPLSSLVLAALFWLAERALESLEGPIPVIGVCHYLALINVVLAVFNLVPAYPLDGGRVLRAGLWAWLKDLRRATWIASRIGRMFGLALILLGALSFIAGNLIGGMWYALIGAYLRGAAGASYGQLVMKQFLEGHTVADLMDEAPPVAAPAKSVRDFVETCVYRHHQRLYPVTENSRLIGCVSIRDIKSIDQAEWGRKTVRDIMSPCSSDNTVRPDARLEELVRSLVTPGELPQRLVVDGHSLKGTISMDDLRELMTIRMELESVGN